MRLRWQKFGTSNCTLAPTPIWSGSEVLPKLTDLENSFEDYQELLRDRDLDAAIICLPNFLHFPASLAALEAGKHVFCEKPPTMNAAEMKVLTR